MLLIFKIIALILMIIRTVTSIYHKEKGANINVYIDKIVDYDILIIIFSALITIIEHSSIYFICTIIWIIEFILDTL